MHKMMLMLVFMTMMMTFRRLVGLHFGAEILPLHGQLTAEFHRCPGHIGLGEQRKQRRTFKTALFAGTEEHLHLLIGKERKQKHTFRQSFPFIGGRRGHLRAAELAEGLMIVFMSNMDTADILLRRKGLCSFFFMLVKIEAQKKGLMIHSFGILSYSRSVCGKNDMVLAADLVDDGKLSRGVGKIGM
ncbi:MAG: hypothetical protein MJ175_10090, partial [Clostridia bacterium]|nr:hypothetical protein [Clostridia bacterium]